MYFDMLNNLFSLKTQGSPFIHLYFNTGTRTFLWGRVFCLSFSFLFLANHHFNSSFSKSGFKVWSSLQSNLNVDSFYGFSPFSVFSRCCKTFNMVLFIVFTCTFYLFTNILLVHLIKMLFKITITTKIYMFRGK